MNKWFRGFGIFLSAMSAVAMGACGGGGDDGYPKWKHSELIDYTQYVAGLTGAKAVTNTIEWDVGGTDLGFPVYNSVTDEMLYFFGDSFGDPLQTSMWRSNTLAFSSDFNFSDGITIADYYKGPTGKAKPVIEGHHTLNFGYEATKIPTGGIEIDGTIYMFYMSIRQWDVWIVNYNGVIKSTDNGKSWERVYDLTWSLTDGEAPIQGLGIEEGYEHKKGFTFTPQSIAADTLILANQDIDLINRTAEADNYINLEGRVAPNFGQIFPIDGLDGYVYIMGIPGGRRVGVKLGRVRKESFEDFSEYEYFTGKDNNGEPRFIKGSLGLEAIFDNDDAFIISEPCGEISFMYNEYLGKWLTVNSVAGGAALSFRVADNIWGEWSQKHTILERDEMQVINPGNTYGGHVHAKLTEENGKIFYIILSQWMPTYNSSLIKVTLK